MKMRFCLQFSRESREGLYPFFMNNVGMFALESHIIKSFDLNTQNIGECGSDNYFVHLTKKNTFVT